METLPFTHAAVIYTFHNARKPRIGREWRSHTERLSASPTVSFWGPFQGQVTNLIPEALGSVEGKNIVLAGSGWLQTL